MTHSAGIGISAGDGMVRAVVLGRSGDAGGPPEILATRVIDVDSTDGFSRAGRVNAAIEYVTSETELSARDTPIAIANRTGDAVARRGGGKRREVKIVCEANATAAALEATGEIARYDRSLIVDLGDTGITTFVVDAAGVPGPLDRQTQVGATAVGGASVDDAIVAALAASDPRVQLALREERDLITSAVRTAKEALGSDEISAVPIGLGNRRDSVTLTRDALIAATAPYREAVHTVILRALDRSPADAVVLIGGMSLLAGVAPSLRADLPVPVVVPEDPASIVALGAALIAAKPGSQGSIALIGGRPLRRTLAVGTAAALLLIGGGATAYGIVNAQSSPDTTDYVVPSTAASTTSTQQSRSSVTLAPSSVVSSSVKKQAPPQWTTRHTTPQLPLTTSQYPYPTWDTQETSPAPTTTTPSPSLPSFSKPPWWPSSWPTWPGFGTPDVEPPQQLPPHAQLSPQPVAPQQVPVPEAGQSPEPVPSTVVTPTP